MLTIIVWITVKVLGWAVKIVLLPFKVLRWILRKSNQKIREIKENAYSQDY